MTKEKIKMKPSIWRRVDIQVSLFTAIVVALLTFSIFWFQYRITYNDTLISLRDQAEAIYGYVEKRLDKSTFDLVRTREDMEGDVYKQAHEAFQRIREISGVRYLYTAKMNEDGEFVYLIDCLDQSEPDFRYPGDLIEHEIYPDMQRALDGQKVLPDRIKDTEWGKIFITYMPYMMGNRCWEWWESSSRQAISMIPTGACAFCFRCLSCCSALGPVSPPDCCSGAYPIPFTGICQIRIT